MAIASASTRAAPPGADKSGNRSGSTSTADPDGSERQTIELDDRGHAEFLLLFRESSETIRFAKALMWKCVGSTLLIEFSLVALGYLTKTEPILARIAVGAGILVACGSIYSLVIYQLWQNTERSKLVGMADAFSEPLRAIRALQSSREANFHRYTLLTFMIIAIAIGQAIGTVALSRLYE